MRPQLWNNCVMCHQVFFAVRRKKTRLYRRRLPGGSSRQGPAIAGARNCFRQFRSSNHAVAIVEQLRDVPPSFFAVRRKKTRLYHQPAAATQGVFKILNKLSV
jgi:hypothetical protein